MKTVHVAMHPKHHLAQKFFINLANQVQAEFRFEPVQITYTDRLTFAQPNKRIHVDDLCRAAYTLKRKHRIPPGDLFVLFFEALAYDEEDEDLFFVSVEDKKSPTPGVAVLSIRYMRNKVLGKSPSPSLVANSVLLNLLAIVACYYTQADTHTDTTGCVLDYCDHMEDIQVALSNGFMFCKQQGCYDLLESTSRGRAILQISGVLTKHMIESRNDLQKLKKIEEPHMMLIASPLWGIRKFRTDPESCFVLMPLKAEFSARIWKLLKQVIRKEGLTPKRADLMGGRKVMDDIWVSINTARVVVADLTDRNPNVFYELGIAHTVGRQCILLAQHEFDIPFDLKGLRVILYEDNADGYKRIREQFPVHVENILCQRA